MRREADRPSDVDTGLKTQNLADLISSIELEEERLGTAEYWTDEEFARLKKISRMRHQLPKGTIVPARGYLGELFHLSHIK